MERLMMLGASNAQIQGIEAAKSLGVQVVTLDYLADAPGHRLSDFQCYESTFNSDAALEAARQYGITGIATMGTDQPVYTAAKVAAALQLPAFISVETAYAVTHKGAMKARFKAHNLPHIPCRLYRQGEDLIGLEELKAPYVIKPVDAQGQRGIHFCETVEDVKSHVADAYKHSRCGEILVENFYASDEVTVTGWVFKGQVHVLAITDRVCFSEKAHLGICLSHEYPSRYLGSHGQEIVHLTRAVCQAFEIQEGPIYFQYLLGQEGLVINEIACRIGGAYEAYYLKALLGIDLCDYLVKGSLGLPYPGETLKYIDVLAPAQALSVQFFFGKAGYIQKLALPPSDFPGLLTQAAFVKEGTDYPGIENATSRVGFAILTDKDKSTLEKTIEAYYGQTYVVDTGSQPMLCHREIGEGWLKREGFF